MPASVSRTFVLGFDGVPWNLLARWANAGELPNVQRLMRSGASGPLESTMPATTAVAWPSIATGTRADKHGIYAFRRLESDYGRTINTSNAIREPAIWEIASPAIVANVPMTYPATDIDGTMVTGMMTPRRDAGFTHPTEFAREIEREIPDYEIGLAWHEYHDREEAFLEDLAAMVDARRDLMRHFMDERDWSMFFFVYTAPDRLQHLIWDEEVILEHYRTLDSILGEAMDYVQKRDANLFVVSDHGFGPVEESVHVNRLLEDGGYLRRKDDGGTRGLFDRLGLQKDAVLEVLDRAGLHDAILSALPDRVIDDIASRIPGDHEMYDVDFATTQAFGYSGRCIYVNDSLRFDEGIVPAPARDGIKKEVQAFLETARHPDTDELLFHVHDGSETFPTDPQAPDLVVESRGNTEVESSLAPEVIQPSTERAAGHRRTGMFLAWGPNIAPTDVQDAQVYDVVPTLLHSQERSLPRNVDGRILDIFEDGSPPERASPSVSAYRRGSRVDDHASDFEDVEDRLRGLGYID